MGSCITFRAVRTTSTGESRGGAPLEGQLPDGQTFHAAGPSDGGWTIFAVHESKESWRGSRRALDARLQEGIEGGFAGPPQETAFEIHNVQP